MDHIVCLVDCRIDRETEDDFLTLNVWGKPVFSYVVEECLQSGCFQEIYLITGSGYLKAVAKDLFSGKVIVTDGCSGWVDQRKDTKSEWYFIVQGGALMLKQETIKNVLKSGGGGKYMFCAMDRNASIVPACPSGENTTSLDGCFSFHEPVPVAVMS